MFIKYLAGVADGCPPALKVSGMSMLQDLPRLCLVWLLLAASGQATAQTQQPGSGVPQRNTEPERFEAGDAEINPRIVGGTPANPGQWASVVALFKRDAFEGRMSVCGGTLISRRFVLTAAHCVDRETPENIFFREGATDLSVAGRTLQAARIIVHPDYRRPSRTRPMHNDMALIELALDAQSPPQALLANSAIATAVKPGSLSTVVGFGATEQTRGFTGFSGAGSDYLLQVDVPIVSQPRCIRRYGAENITAATICAGLEQGGQDSCQGDSGGPLFMALRTGQMAQVGVVSWGAGCARPNAFGVYASVGHFEAWVRNHVPDATFADAAPPPDSTASPLPVAAPAPVTNPPASTPAAPVVAAAPAPVTKPAPAPAVAAAPARPDPTAVPVQPPAPAPQIILTDEELASLVGPVEAVPPSQMAQVSIDTDTGTQIKVGSTIRIKVRSSMAGQLVVYNQNAEGKAYQVFPNRFSRPQAPGKSVTEVAAGQTIAIPGPSDGFQMRLAPPTGRNRLIAVVMPVQAKLAEAVAAQSDMRSFDNLTRGLQRVAATDPSPPAPTRRAVGILTYEIVP